MTDTPPDAGADTPANTEPAGNPPGAPRVRTSDPSPPEAIFGPDTLGGQRDIPDMRRDAIEEASETSGEARERFDRLNAREAEADPALHRLLNQAP